MNIVENIIEVLNKHNKSTDDILWVGSRDGKYSLSWDEFISKFSIIEDMRYLAIDFVVVGNNWWIQREEYDDQEWWCFMSPPIKKAAQPFTKILSSNVYCYDEDLETINS